MEKKIPINFIIVDNTNNLEYRKFAALAEKVYEGWKVFCSSILAVEYIRDVLKDDDKFVVLLHANGREGYDKLGFLQEEFIFVFPKITVYYISTERNFTGSLNSKSHYTVFPVGDLQGKIDNGKVVPQTKNQLIGKNSTIVKDDESVTDNNEINKKDSIVKNIQKVLAEYSIDKIVGGSAVQVGLYNDFSNFIGYLKNSEDVNWLRSLIEKENVCYPNVSYFENPYWNFRTTFFDTYFPSLGDLYAINLKEEEANVHCDSNRKWHINIRLFRAFIRKYTFDTRFLDFFENGNNSEIGELLTSTTVQARLDDFKRRLRLFILHEALHKIHNINEFTVNGIGYHPRIIEEADYQADVFVIISEFFYTLSKNDGQYANGEKVIDLFVEIIKIAINTTMSFAGKGKLKSIQVRRFQRYTIWVFVITLIEQLRTKAISSRNDTINAVLDIFSTKPILDIYGLKTDFESDPNAPSNATTPKLYVYNFESMDLTKVKIGCFHKNYVDKRIADTERVDMLIRGIRESEYRHLTIFIDSIKDTVRFP